MKSITLPLCLLLPIFFLSIGITTPSLAQESEQLFQQGLMKENGEGNLLDAIGIYQQIVADQTAEEAVQAKAQLHIGLCYEKLGKSEAIKAYELVLENYKKYNKEVEMANLRLAGLVSEGRSNESGIINLCDKGASVTSETMVDNPSLSPDGNRLVGIDYSIGQNVAIYDIITKEIELVTTFDWTTDGRWTYYPTWLPDGKEVAYMMAAWDEGPEKIMNEIRVSDLNGNSRTMIKNENEKMQVIPVEWSQDGSLLLALKQDSAASYFIGVVTADNPVFKPLHKMQWETPNQEGLVLSKRGLTLSPDGQYVVFADGPDENKDLYILSTEKGEPVLLSGHPNNEYNPLWSPDGKHVIFIRETKGEGILYALEIDDGKPVKHPMGIKEGMQNVELCNWTDHGLTYSTWLDLHDIYTVGLDPETGLSEGNPEPLQFTPTGSNIQPVWSHDGRYFAFIAYGDLPRIILIPTDGSEKRSFPIEAPGFWELSLYDLNWVKDNSALSFCVQSPTGIPTVYRLDIASGNWEHWELSFSGWSRTAWGPDENTFIYTRNGEENAGLYVFDINMGKSDPVFKPETKEEYYVFRSLKFSRDRKKLGCDMTTPSGKKLLVVDMQSGESKVMGDDYSFGSFSPDGKKIIVRSSSGIAVLSKEGSVLQQNDLFKHFPEGTRFMAIDWSPDGEQLVINIRHSVFGTYLMKNVLK